MKVRLTVELDLPDDFEKYTDRELLELIDGEYFNYITCSHTEDALKWCAKGKIGTENEDPLDKRIFENHAMWSEICKRSKWTIEEKITPGKQESFDPLYLPAKNVSPEQQKQLLELAIECRQMPLPDEELTASIPYKFSENPVMVFGFNAGDANNFVDLAKKLGVEILQPPPERDGVKFIPRERKADE